MNPTNELNPHPHRPTTMEVNLAALGRNLKTIKRTVSPAKIMGVVKANGYGHGLVACAQKLVSEGIDYLGVAFVEEGIELRQAGITTPILVFGGIFGSQIKLYLDYDLELTASSVSKLRAIEETASTLKKRAKVHLKIDTGLERIGVHYYSAEELLKETLSCKFCECVGIFSHFATADSTDLTFMKLQLERFHEVLGFYEKHSVPRPLRHIANSAALLQSKETHLDMVRPGISLYGVYSEPHLEKLLPLEPVMSLVSSVVYFKVVKKGNGVSYGHTWIAPEDTRIVTVPIGYGDGYSRRLSNVGSVLIRNKRYPIVGNVCMDQIMVNLGKDGEAYNGDRVVLIGSQGSEQITVNDIASQTGTIAHETLTSTNLRVPRKYY